MPIANEDFWEDLLVLIEGGNVLPVVGQGVTTMGPEDALLAPWLARQLADRLNLSGNPVLPPQPTLNEVICHHLVNGGMRQVVDTRLHRILNPKQEAPVPGQTLERLASVSGFRLFISTTFDCLLVRALNAKRHNRQAVTRVYAYSPRQPEDLPARKTDLPGSTVYHILGNALQVDHYVAWEDDLLEFVCGLNRHLVPDVMPHLSRDLVDSSLLVLGLNFSDWLVRFFLRVAHQDRLSNTRPQVDYLVDGPGETVPRGHVMFFGSVVKNIQVIPCNPREFIAELAYRWTERHPDGTVPLAAASASPPREMPRGAIFISYAREDSEAVRRLKAGLEAQGCTVWFDIDRLKSGMRFDERIEDEVKKHCSLFVSVISQNTERQAEAYFHMERNWAAEREKLWADVDRDEFYHPVIIDDLDPDKINREPRAFSRCNRVNLPDGNVTLDFAQRLYDLQQKHRGPRLP